MVTCVDGVRLCGLRAVTKGANAIGADADADVSEAWETAVQSSESIRGELIGSDHYTRIAVDPSIETAQLLLNNNGCFTQHDDARFARARIRILKNIRNLQNRRLCAMAIIPPAHKEHFGLRINTSI
jgi:hypothetical protein